MYLYVNGSSFEAIALMPAHRGRPAKNHCEVTHGPLSFYFADPATPDAARIKQSPEYIKEAVAHGDVTPLFMSGGAPDAHRAVMKLGEALLTFGTSLPKSFLESLLETSRLQLKAALDGLESAVAAEDRDETAEIISKNQRMFNALLIANPAGTGWWHDDAKRVPYTEKQSSKSKTAAPAKVEETLDEKVAKIEQMTATTVSFGFGKLSGESPELRIAEEEHDREVAAAEGVFLPKPDETYIINEQVAQLFKILQISRLNCPQNVRLLGPHGCGKTELAIQFAARLELPLLIMDCANLREARDWFGYKGAKDGTVYWHESQFVKAVTAGNHVILLDELNRANPHLLNTLMPLLDARRFTYLEERGSKICVGPGTVFFASMNEGAGYTGTSALDRAIRDRFPRVIEMSYLGEQDEIKLLMRRVGINEDIATRLVGMANKIRQDSSGLAATLTESLSTRQLIAAAHDFAIGGVDTLTFTVSNHFSPDGDDESERVRVQSIIQGKFGDILAAQAAAAAKKGA
jgi:MoxR-like ATPase